MALSGDLVVGRVAFGPDDRARVVATERYITNVSDPRAVWGSQPPPDMPRAERIELAWQHFARQWELTEAEQRLLMERALVRRLGP